MVIYLDEENAYIAWITRHRDGFVLDGMRSPSRRRYVLHRTTCETVRASKTKATHWTTGRHFKACAMDLQELVAWSMSELEKQPGFCEHCTPQRAPELGADSNDAPLTKLDHEVLDYVVDVAVIHLDAEEVSYDLKVSDVAGYLEKSVSQIAAALPRLNQAGYLQVVGNANVMGEITSSTRLVPTTRALRALPAFENASTLELEAELGRLTNLG